MGAPEGTGAGAARIDRWLFGVRLFKSRSAATDAVSGGKVHINGERVKPSRGIKPGDTVIFTLRRRVRVRGGRSAAASWSGEQPGAML